MVDENWDPKSISSNRSWQNMVVPVPRAETGTTTVSPSATAMWTWSLWFVVSSKQAIAFNSMDWFGAKTDSLTSTRNLLRAFLTKVLKGAGMQLVFVNTKLLGASSRPTLGKVS